MPVCFVSFLPRPKRAKMWIVFVVFHFNFIFVSAVACLLFMFSIGFPLVMWWIIFVFFFFFSFSVNLTCLYLFYAILSGIIVYMESSFKRNGVSVMVFQFHNVSENYYEKCFSMKLFIVVYNIITTNAHKLIL